MSYRRWLFYFLSYNALFFLLQLVYILTKSQSFLNAIPLPMFVWLELITTFLAHCGLIFLLTLVQLFLFWGVCQWYPHHPNRTHLTIWLLSIAVLLSSNAYFYPLSQFSQLLFPFPLNKLIPPLWMFALILLGLIGIMALFKAVKKRPFITTITCIVASSSLFFTFFTKLPIEHPPQSTQPNLIVIGIDSMAPGRINSKDTPYLDNLIHQSVFFKETISPLARTYPAWMSILTGQYPKHHRAQYNLLPTSRVNHSKTLAWMLQKQGYTTVFATDDRRFNHIDTQYGFQKIIGPKTGVNDMILGTFNDFPLSNLIANTSIGAWLFPYNHLNRASHFLYYPKLFSKKLNQEISSPSLKSPLFLAVHFTLPHWPYAYANASPDEVLDRYQVTKRAGLYLKAIRAADQQVQTLLFHLKQQGWLENSLVILLSDHGEALYEKGSRQTLKSTYQGGQVSRFENYVKKYTTTSLEKSAGHGSDLLSAEQYHCILAFQIYQKGQNQTSPYINHQRVSLIDIAPTVSAYLKTKPFSKYDGISLLPAIVHPSTVLPKRTFFLESGMLPNQFLSQEKARALGKFYFEISPQGKLQLNVKRLQQLDHMKLYAILENHWLLALYPEKGDYLPVLMSTHNHHWVDDLNHPFAQKAPSYSMLQKLKQFYGLY